MSTIYVHDEDHNRYEGMTKEQIIYAIVQAVAQGEITDLDDGFITKIKELNGNQNIQIWIGTTAQFNAIATKAANTLYILTDDDSADSWDTIAEQLNTLSDEYDDIVSGATTVSNAATVKCTHANESVIADGYNSASEQLFINFRGAEGEHQIKEVLFCQGDRDVNKFARITTPCNTDFTHRTWSTYIDGTALSSGTYEMRLYYASTYFNFGVVTWDGVRHTYSTACSSGTTLRYVEIGATGNVHVYEVPFDSLTPSRLILGYSSGINIVLEYRRIQ